MDNYSSPVEVIDADFIFARVERILPVLRAHAEEAERSRQLSQPAVDALRCAGAFRMVMSKAWGGPSSTPAHKSRLSRTSPGERLLCFLPREPAARQLYTQLDAVTAGFQAPNGVLQVCDGVSA
jgi:hypothetical protein